MIAVVELPTLAVGDKVTLRSGSPALTVVAIEGDVISCTWFNGSEMCGADLPRACVDRIGVRVSA